MNRLKLAAAAVALLAALGASLTIPEPASASAPAPILLTIVNQSRYVTRAEIRQAEAVTTKTADGRLAAEWDTPDVQYVASGGWPIYLSPDGSPPGMFGQPAPAGAAGYHGLDGTEPYAVVANNVPGGNSPWTGGALNDFAFSHEVYEMIVDPDLDRMVNNQLAEVCDPVESDFRQWAQFVSPAWFLSQPSGVSE